MPSTRCRWSTRRWAWVAFAAGVSVHSLLDLLVHHHDAHRHLWPLSDWRFHSPVSYWDERFHADWYRLVEAVALAASAAYCGRWRPRPWLGVALVAALSYAGFLLWASLTWG